MLKLEAARSRQDATSRDALLTEIKDETKAAITEIRRAVDELRPPAIDELGLAGAIGQRAASLTTGDLVFEMCLAPNLPPLPAASEVAAFRIASEAMTNVARHSGATRCRPEVAARIVTTSRLGQARQPQHSPPSPNANGKCSQ